MNARNWSILGLALLLVFSLMVGLPGSSQAQQNDTAAAYSSTAQGNASGYYGYNGGGYAYCPMGPGYGYSAPADQNYRNYATRSRNNGYRGARAPWNAGYNRGYRGGWGCGW
jgi:hypothetical protein